MTKKDKDKEKSLILTRMALSLFDLKKEIDNLNKLGVKINLSQILNYYFNEKEDGFSVWDEYKET